MAGCNSHYFQQYSSPNIVIVPTINESVPAEIPEVNNESCPEKQNEKSFETTPVQNTETNPCENNNGKNFMKTYKIPLTKSSTSWASNYIASIGQQRPVTKLNLPNRNKKLNQDIKTMENLKDATTTQQQKTHCLKNIFIDLTREKSPEESTTSQTHIPTKQQQKLVCLKNQFVDLTRRKTADKDTTSQSQNNLKKHIDCNNFDIKTRSEIKLNLIKKSKNKSEKVPIGKPKTDIPTTNCSSKTMAETNLNSSNKDLVDMKTPVASRKRKYSDDQTFSKNQVTTKKRATKLTKSHSDSKTKKICENKSCEVKRVKVTKSSTTPCELKPTKKPESRKTFSKSESLRPQLKTPRYSKAKRSPPHKTSEKHGEKTSKSPIKKSASRNLHQTKVENSIHIKSVIQKVADKKEETKKSNIKTRLELNTLNSHFSQLLANRNQEIRERLDRRSNLRIIVDNDNIKLNMSQADTQINAPKIEPPKSKKYKKIKFVINVIRKRSLSSSSSSESEDGTNITQQNNVVLNNEDLSFLDDFNIDEIVESLIDYPETDLNENKSQLNANDKTQLNYCTKLVEQNVTSDLQEKSFKSEKSDTEDKPAQENIVCVENKIKICDSIDNKQTIILCSKGESEGVQAQDTNIVPNNLDVASVSKEDTHSNENNTDNPLAVAEIEETKIEIKSEKIRTDNLTVLDIDDSIILKTNSPSEMIPICENKPTIDLNETYIEESSETLNNVAIVEPILPHQPNQSPLNSEISIKTKVYEENINKINDNRQNVTEKSKSPDICNQETEKGQSTNDSKDYSSVVDLKSKEIVKKPIDSSSTRKIWIGSISLTTTNIEETIESTIKNPFKIMSLICYGKYSTLLRCKNSKNQSFALKITRDKSQSYHDLCVSKERNLRTLQYDIPRENLHLPHHYKGLSLYGHWTFIMDYYPKNMEQSMEELMRPFHIDKALALSRQLISAVTLLRNNGYVHADIKPTHILMNTTNDKLKLCGFDQSYHISDVRRNCELGTLNYRAPEIVLGHSAGYTIDVWSTALVIFEMVTKQLLFPSFNNNDLLYRQQCALGHVPWQMVKNSAFKGYHFHPNNKAFLRRHGKGQVGVWQKIEVIERITKINILKTSIFKAYFTHWAGTRTQLQRKNDISKMNKLHTLLLKMLTLNPEQRIPIEFVYSNPFVFSS